MRDLTYRRRLPIQFGSRPIWVTPDSRLRFLKPGATAFDHELLRCAERYVRPGDIVLDIGANVGEFALAAAHCAGMSGAVLAVEPDPYLAFLLQRTRAESVNQDVNLQSLCAAVSCDLGMAHFALAFRGRAANALLDRGSTQMGGIRQDLLVPTITVDLIAHIWRVPSIIKIDVEGGERLVLEGAREVLIKHRPILLLEVSRERNEIERILHEIEYVFFDPAVGDLSVPLTHCIFDTLAVPEERVKAL